MDIRFYKLHVCGVDWLLADRIGMESGPIPDFEALSRGLCGRRRGAGGHGLIALSKPERDIWAECFGPDGAPLFLPPDAALCAARYLFDSGRGEKDALELRTRGGAVRVDVIDSTRFALSLGPALTLSGLELTEGDVEGSTATIDVGNQSLSILPVRVARALFAVVFAESGLKAALAPFGAGESPLGSFRERITPLAIRVVSRMSLAVGGHPLDACSAAGAALAAARAYGLANEEAAIRFGRDAIYVSGDSMDGLYAAASPVYIFSGEYWMEEGAPEEESR